MIKIDPPLALLAELTHRCPLSCPYCSNPLEMDARSAELDTETWYRVLTEAKEIGALQVHFSGGEPTLRPDLVDLVAHADKIGLYCNLITAAVSLTEKRLESLKEAGLAHVQISFQGTDTEIADRIAGFDGAFERKTEAAAHVINAGLALTLNAVINRHNVEQLPDFFKMAAKLKARRLEVAHVQYYGWALKNRAALLPSRAQVERTTQLVEEARREYEGNMVIDYVIPDYYARRPKSCMNGWARRFFNITPAGKVLPCHAAETISHLSFPTVHDGSLSDIWHNDPAFNAYRGTDWMPETCQKCDNREIDWGGCRCQAMALTGDAANMDPVCELSPFKDKVLEIAKTDAGGQAPDFIYRISPSLSEKNAASSPDRNTD